MAFEVTHVLLPRYTLLQRQESESSQNLNNWHTVIDTALLLVWNVLFKACRAALAQQQDCSSTTISLLRGFKNWHRSTMQRCSHFLHCHPSPRATQTTWYGFVTLNQEMVFLVCHSVSELLYFLCYPLLGFHAITALLQRKPFCPPHEAWKLHFGGCLTAGK